MKGIFNRTELLLGSEMMDVISAKRVIIFGVGGVGSWCAESLVRSGVEHLTVVDSDRVCVTNINRQLMATCRTIGKVKVDALKDRLHEINPTADIEAIQEIYSEETAASFHLEQYDYIIDCIDSLKDKISLLLTATQYPATVFSSMDRRHRCAAPRPAPPQPVRPACGDLPKGTCGASTHNAAISQRLVSLWRKTTKKK